MYFKAALHIKQNIVFVAAARLCITMRNDEEYRKYPVGIAAVAFNLHHKVYIFTFYLRD